MTTPKPLKELEEKLNYQFRDIGLLRQAVTHSTHANEHPKDGPDNERLEFLGDAVLDLIVAKMLYEGPREQHEGEMSRLRAHVVRKDSFAKLASALQLMDYLLLGEGQRRSGGTEGILADTYEAVVAAVFLDGGYEAVESCVGKALGAAIEAAAQKVDFKTRLQEVCHVHGLGQPRYVVLEIDGPDHARVFSCEVEIRGEALGAGSGASKKAAEQSCAELALNELASRGS